MCVVGGCVETTSFSLPEVHEYLRSGPAEDVLCVFDWHEMMPPPQYIKHAVGSRSFPRGRSNPSCSYSFKKDPRYIAIYQRFMTPICYCMRASFVHALLSLHWNLLPPLINLFLFPPSLSHGIANAMSLTIERNQAMVVPFFVRARSSVSAVFFLAVVFPPPSKSSC